MALTKLIGEKLIKGKSKEEVTTSQFEGSGKVLGIYFSAHWCPPCRAFTPQLAQWYQKFKEGPNGSKFDIVFVSSDRDEASFDEYFQEMPWHAIPYSDRERKNDLSRKFKISGIPSLLFLSGDDGHLITNEGRSIVMEDPEGKEFPWTPKPISELINGDLVTSKDGKTTWSDVKEKVDAVGIYFSAHWCGPCRAFTPQLVKTYDKLKEAGKKFEIIFCSSDRDEDSFKEYFESMPWLALPFGDSRKKSLSRAFDVSGIPTLVILDKECKTITAYGRAAVSADPEGKEFPWYPKPVNKLTGMSAGDINDAPSIVWFTDNAEDTATAKDALFPVAKEYIEKCKESNADPEVLFFYTDKEDEDDIATSLRSFAKLPDKNPLLTLVDIPEQMLYVVDEKPLGEKQVRDLLEGYQKKTLEGRPLKQ